jgi:predicted membrane-bound spermidine synthase
MPLDQLRRRVFLPAVLLLFTASGFSGLIYESVWSHYLKLFLGHAAYAQTLVLAIFMGGMALGAWIASRLSPRWRDLLLAYALVEVLIGLASLGFHRAFFEATALAFDEVIPGLGSPIAAQVFKWTLASLLILPQSVLLGMTFPLMTGGVLRLRPERAGYTVAMLYFTNSLGAAVGVLASGFYFIGQVGLPGTIIAAGVVNLAVAALVLLLRPAAAGTTPAAPATAPAAPVPGARLLLVVAGLTGFSSFLYEIGWIRMLALVLGSSTHAFELMLSAFILGIAFGGLWMRRRIDAAAEPMRLLAGVQVVMGIAAVATLPIYGSSFVAMEAAMQALTRTAGGYVAFNLFSHGIALAVMFPAAFCAGMTLPLITAALLRRGAGESAIGQVYAANTAGAIAGVAAAVHLGFPLLGLKGMIVAGAAIDVALGVALIAAAGGRAPRAWATGVGAVAAGVLLAVALGVELDAQRMSSGVYRYGKLPLASEQSVELHLDGKTSTVTVARTDKALALLTNGKSDGAVSMGVGGPSDDEVMMTLLGALPQLLAPQARRVANIGFGTGMTTHVLLASERIESVDTIEIEPAMVRAAPLFRPYNARALDDARSHLHFEDAKTFFSSSQARYDVIVSEPSNPWVSGISSLFSLEFYRHARRYLNDDGLLFQWVQAYEISPALLASILHALEASFPEYELWMPSHGDLIIVAAKNGAVPRPDPRAFASPRLRAELARFQIRNVDDLLLHRIGGNAALAAYFLSFPAPTNSDFFPYLDLHAQQARFQRSQADTLPQLLEVGLPLFELFDSEARSPDPRRMTQGVRPWLRRATYAEQARSIATYLRLGETKLLEPLSGALANDATLVRAALVDCRLVLAPAALRDSLASIAWLVNQHLALKERQTLWSALEASRCGKPEAAERRWLRLHAAVGSANAAAMAAAAAAVLDNSADLPQDLLARAVAARIAGLILTDQAIPALRETSRYRGRLGNSENTQTLFRFLLAQAEQGGRTQIARPAAK